MARTAGPLMSLEASGSLANTIVFSKWKGRPYVRQLVVPANPNSALQLSTRSMMRFLSQQWTPNVGTTPKASWAPIAKSMSISEFNAFVRTNLQRWTQFTAPGMTNPVVPAGTLATFTALPTVVAGVRQATFSWTVNVLSQAWGLLIFQSLTNAFAVSRDTLVFATHLGAGAGSALVTPIKPGTYFWNFVSFTDTGKQSTALGQVTGTVT
jgi:hypothetical protein